MTCQLFTPFAMRGLTLPNRIVISPMCQYSADDGAASDWHMQHLGSLAHSGAGLLMIEASAVERPGRISHGCLGLYSDNNELALAHVVAALRRFGNTPLGIQLAHAGRKGSAQRPWEGGGSLRAGQDLWETVAPSAIPMAENWQVPRAAEEADLERIRTAFVDATRRAARLGLDLVEAHCAHGYLSHEFLSPLSNKRTDRYGGSLENRARLVREIATAMRAVMPDSMPLFTRISCTDWVEGGWDLAQSIELAKMLKPLGVDLMDCSSGALVKGAKIPIGPGFQ